MTALLPVMAVLDEGRFPNTRAAAKRFPELDQPVARLLRLCVAGRTMVELDVDDAGLLHVSRGKDSWTATLDPALTGALFAWLDAAHIGDIPQWPLMPGSSEVTLSLGGGAAVFGSLADAAAVPTLKEALAALVPLLRRGDGDAPAGVTVVRRA